MTARDSGDESLASLPPLRIHHFLIWMAVAAVALSVNEITNTLQSDFGERQVALEALGFVWHSLALCCLGLGIYWYKKGKGFFELPGHGLLVISSVEYVFQLVFTWAAAIHFFNTDPTVGPPIPSWPVMTVLIIGSLTMTGLIIYLNVRFARRFSAFRRWRRYFIASALVVLWQSLLPVLTGFSLAFFVGRNGASIVILLNLLPQILLTVYLFVIMMIDLDEGHRFHWSHYAGIVVVIGSTLSTSIGRVLGYFYLFA